MPFLSFKKRLLYCGCKKAREKKGLRRMENSIPAFKTTILTALGALGGFISSLFGGWDSALTTLVIFMAIDYVTGLLVAGVIKKSKKSENGALESRAGWKGLCRKGKTLLILLIAVQLDLAMESAFIRDGVVIAYVINEAISITENAGLMGMPVPSVIQKAIDVLQKKSAGDKL